MKKQTKKELVKRLTENYKDLTIDELRERLRFDNLLTYVSIPEEFKYENREN